MGQGQGHMTQLNTHAWVICLGLTGNLVNMSLVAFVSVEKVIVTVIESYHVTMLTFAWSQRRPSVIQQQSSSAEYTLPGLGDD